MISVVNNHQLYEEDGQRQHHPTSADYNTSQVEMSVADSSTAELSTFTFSQDSRTASFNQQEQDILQQMMKNKIRRRSSGVTKTRRHSTSSNSALNFSDSIATVATELDSPYQMSASGDDSNSVASRSGHSTENGVHMGPARIGFSNTNGGVGTEPGTEPGPGLGDRIGAAVELETEGQSVTSSNASNASSFSGSVEPLKRRLSRDEENAFMMSENTGDFSMDDSFGDLDETSFNSKLAAKAVANRPSPSGSGSRKGLMRRAFSASSLVAAGRANSKRSLYSVNEGEEVQPGPMTQRHNSNIASSPQPLTRKLSVDSVLTANSSFNEDDQSVDVSLDPASIFEERLGKKLSPVKERKKKKSSKSSRSSTATPDTGTSTPVTESTKKSRKSSSKKNRKKKTPPPSPKPEFAESADDILKRWNSKIDLIEKEVEALDLKEKNRRFQEASSGDMGLTAPRELFVESSQGNHFAGSLGSPRLTSPRSRMTRHLSISCMSSAGSSLSGDSAAGGVQKQQQRDSHQGNSISVPRRPSLHSLFEWNKQPSQLNLDVNAPNVVVNTSRQPDRRQRLRRCMSTTDISQYNNTPHWPPSRRQTNRNLHAQFYRRDTNLQTPKSVNRGLETSPVVTSEQMLEVMEPVTMREVLAFNGLGQTNKQGSRKLVNYGDILDNQSSSSLNQGSNNSLTRGL